MHHTLVSCYDGTSEQRSDRAATFDETESNSDGTAVVDWGIAQADIIADQADSTNDANDVNAANDTVDDTSIDPTPESNAPPPNNNTAELTNTAP